MSTAHVRHGRPKGSGLNDRQQLVTIAALVAADPKLKPTTAIRSLGVDDPSVIRRLRDKFRAEEAELMAHARRAANSNTMRPIPPSAAEAAGSPPAQLHSAAVPEAKALPRQSPPGALLAAWCGFGMRAMSVAMENQITLTQQWMRLPPVSAAIRSQLAFQSFALALYQPRKGLQFN